jgi:hypothetical protein
LKSKTSINKKKYDEEEIDSAKKNRSTKKKSKKNRDKSTTDISTASLTKAKSKKSTNVESKTDTGATSKPAQQTSVNVDVNKLEKSKSGSSLNKSSEISSFSLSENVSTRQGKSRSQSPLGISHGGGVGGEYNNMDDTHMSIDNNDKKRKRTSAETIADTNNGHKNMKRNKKSSQDNLGKLLVRLSFKCRIIYNRVGKVRNCPKVKNMIFLN